MREVLQRRVRSTELPFCAHAVGEEEIAEVAATLGSAWITTGPKVKQFEEDFSRFVGAPAALAVNSCTAALHLALVTLGVGPGHRVITSPMTFCASVNVIEHVGARPLLVDVEPDTLNIAPRQVEAALARAGHDARTEDREGPIRAILPIHLHGHPYEVDSILGLARDYNLDVIEDAAHALGAAYRTRPVGAWAAGTTHPAVRYAPAFAVFRDRVYVAGGQSKPPCARRT